MKPLIATLSILLLASCGSQEPPEWASEPISHPTIHYDCPVVFLDSSERVCWEKSITTKGRDD
jgi:hypothetical protein